jgi:hypothetical protein
VRRLALRLEREGYRVADVTVQHPSAPEAVVDLAADVPGALVAISKPDAEPLIGTMERGTAVQVLRGSTVPVVVAGASRGFGLRRLYSSA